jgi:hypothetical protein
MDDGAGAGEWLLQDGQNEFYAEFVSEHTPPANGRPGIRIGRVLLTCPHTGDEVKNLDVHVIVYGGGATESASKTLADQLLSESTPTVGPGTPSSRQDREAKVRAALQALVDEFGTTGLNTIGKVYDEMRRNRRNIQPAFPDSK